MEIIETTSADHAQKDAEGRQDSKRESGDWLSRHVPDEVVERLDACAETGEGPYDDLIAWAYEVTTAQGMAIGEEEDGMYMPDWNFGVFLRDRYGWAVPSGEALDAIAAHFAGKRVVEIGSGSGYVAACLRSRGLEVQAVNAPRCGWSEWWKNRFIEDFTTATATELSYEENCYVMMMPDGLKEGDMMSEALFRMPVGAMIALYAPKGCSGSARGQALAKAHFETIEELDLIYCYRFEPRSRNRIKVLRKTSRPERMPEEIKERPFWIPRATQDDD